MFEDSSGFTIGQRVYVDDGYSEFEGVYVGLTSQGDARVKDDDTEEIIIGSLDFVEAL